MAPILEKQFTYLYAAGSGGCSGLDSGLKFVELEYKRGRKSKVVVLDLDETLVHTELGETSSYDLKLSFVMKSKKSVFYVKFRPHLVWFLEQLKEVCNVVIYTAADRQYAEEVRELRGIVRRLPATWTRGGGSSRACCRGSTAWWRRTRSARTCAC